MALLELTGVWGKMIYENKSEVKNRDITPLKEHGA